MFKMGLHDPFGHLKHKLRQFDSEPLKVQNLPDFLVCRGRATYRWKDLNEGYNFSLDLTLIRHLRTKLWASKVIRDPI